MPMSQEHKDALAEGRRQSRAIKAYLGAIKAKKPGRPVTRETIEARLQRVSGQLVASEDPLESVELVQLRLDLEAQLAAIGDSENMAELEKGFVDYARGYSDRKGISYTAWREVGVPAAVLRQSGIRETRRR
jgi:hypothetical protein